MRAIILFVILTSFLITQAVYGSDTAIEIINLTDSVLVFRVAWIDETGDVRVFDDEPTIMPGKSHQFFTPYGIVTDGNLVAVQVNARTPGFGLHGAHIEKQWGRLVKREYLKAKINSKEALIRISICVK